MPIYEYRCKKCGQFEVMCKISDGPRTRCPTCRGKVTKLISSTSFQLKGSGWYATDYARKTAPAKGDGKSETETASTAGAKDTASDTKAQQPDSKPGKATAPAAA